MKVVLFCGGLGMRLREVSESIPKPMVAIGYRPILWHVMKYYAHFGHHDFILCLGYKADSIKNYFRTYDECLSNDFVLSRGGQSVRLYNSDIQDWSITFADTGIASSIGQRLRAVRKYLEGEDCFLANYTDGLTDLHLPDLIEFFGRQDRTACLLSVKPHLTYHFVNMTEEGRVTGIIEAAKTSVRANGGFFVFRKEIFDYIGEGEELVNEPFQRLIRKEQLVAYPYDGFWKNMDTFKDKQELEELHARGHPPWEVWRARGE